MDSVLVLFCVHNFFRSKSQYAISIVFGTDRMIIRKETLLKWIDLIKGGEKRYSKI